ncbi:MAG TPA: GNAT family N-acetyltransferase [Devosia sp.]|nr:GNAT family N-acetyltransferase [Devosia sp.]
MAAPACRPLAAADAPGWGALRHALWPAEPLDELQAELGPMLEAGDFAGFGMFDGGTLIGFAEVSERPYGDGCVTAPVAWLEAIYILPAWRRRGIARQLVAAAEGWARARGLSELGSDAALDNLVSRLSHARWGFEETERVVRFRKQL